jgi:hypothetical protein
MAARCHRAARRAGEVVVRLGERRVGGDRASVRLDGVDSRVHVLEQHAEVVGRERVLPWRAPPGTATSASARSPASCSSRPRLTRACVQLRIQSERLLVRGARLLRRHRLQLHPASNHSAAPIVPLRMRTLRAWRARAAPRARPARRVELDVELSGLRVPRRLAAVAHDHLARPTRGCAARSASDPAGSCSFSRASAS